MCSLTAIVFSWQELPWLTTVVSSDFVAWVEKEGLPRH